VNSEPNQGTSFKIYLPAVRESVPEPGKTKDSGSSFDGTEKILLVEDDALLRAAFQQSLAKAGYDVVAAADAEEGTKYFLENAGEFDLLMSDVILPTATGGELFTELKKLNPTLKGLFVSGYTENSVSRLARLDPEIKLVQKPVSIRTLLSSVRQVLDERSVKV
ncbi:MAG: response regulator, partial [Bdellovibrionota bacterium]